MTKVVIDHVLGVEIDYNSFPLRNIQILDQLKFGMNHIAQIVRDCEIKALCDDGVIPAPVFSLDINTSIACMFGWFVISAVNYSRVVGLLKLMDENGWSTDDIARAENCEIVRVGCTKYAEMVIGELVCWRNKCVAHPAATYPNINDSKATLEYSLMSLVSYMKPYYIMGGTKWCTGGEKSKLPEWALTKIYEEKIIPRFWPDDAACKLKPIDV